MIIETYLPDKLREQMQECKRTWGMGFLCISDVLLLPFLVEMQRDVVKRFVTEVEKEAETNMIKTGKLEGAHYAAMKRLAKTI